MNMRSKVIIALAGLAIAAGVGCTGMAEGNQPHMQNALAALETARSELAMAEHNKGGHRVRAIGLVNEAIAEVQAGIAVGAGD